MATTSRRDDHAAASFEWTLVIAVILATLVPCLVTRFVPATDLPQHLAQIRLARDVLSGVDVAHTIRWGAPNTLVYLPLAVAYALFGPMVAGRVIIALLSVASLGAVAIAARVLRRSPVAVIVAAPFVFDHVLSWGFLNFIAGWPLFVAWIVVTPRADERARVRRDPFFTRVVLAFALALGHVLWLAAACAYTAWLCVASRDGAKPAIRRALPLVPALLYSLAVTVRSGAFRVASGFDMAVHFHTPVWSRLSLPWLEQATLGALRSPFEWIAFAAGFAWIVTGLLSARRDGRRADPTLAAAAATLAIAAMFLPDMAFDTVFLAERFAPYAAMLAILAAPAPRIAPRAIAIAATSIACALVTATALAWHRFDRDEMSGLPAALAQTAPSTRVVGVDFVLDSRWLRGEPFLQVFAYASAVRGAPLAFSFAQHATGLVRTNQPVPLRIETAGTFEATGAFPAAALDLGDVVIVHADEARHASLQRDSRLHALNDTGSWRSYRVTRR